MIILKILLGIIIIGIVIILIKLALAVIGVAIGLSLVAGMFSGIFYLLGWIESKTVFSIMKWAFIIGIPGGIAYVICNPSEVLKDSPNSSSKSSGNKIYRLEDEYSNRVEGEERNGIVYGNDGHTYEQDGYGDWHKRD